MWRESREIWPEVVAPDLRRALYAKHKGDLEVSEQHFRRALQLLLPLPTDALRGDPHLKVTGVAIALADLLESQGKTKEAYDTYADGFEYLRRVQLNSPLSGPETLRLISIAYKLGELAGQLKLTEDEEKWLVVAVEQILKDAGRSAGKHGSLQQASSTMDTQSSGSPEGLAGIDLPGWASAVDIAAPLEALAEFYEQRGQTEYALPLYLHSASVLVPPKSEKQTSPEDQCRGANMMLKISELILRGPESKHTLHSAEAWAQKGLAVVQEARSKSWGTVPICEEMLVAAYHGAGLLRELSGDGDGARKLYSAAIVQGKSLSLHMTQEVEMLHERILALRPQK
ncbi:hypothetical protein CCMSSC00406_0005629 [Pleurotus cornucopiae]|uniref:Uncharacterized protein n=1 Tax=Pleurotus cornucopiae TaxID=5321 RepID=A0ACB7IVR9_PLECO|nr:hypothetical protein CCMSSC00406_0005629 [Pleurotus cornucopiae]